LESGTPDDPEVFANAVGYIQMPTGRLFDSEVVNPRWKTSSDLYGMKRNVDKKLEVTREFKLFLFNRQIFSWQLTKKTAAATLGGPAQAAIERPLDMKPYCTALFSAPTLRWEIPDDAVAPVLKLEKIVNGDEVEIVPETSLEGKDGLSLEGVRGQLNAGERYRWEISYKRGGQWCVRNGIFELMAGERRETYLTQKAKLLVGERPSDSLDTFVAHCALLVRYRLYDTAVSEAVRYLEKCKDPLEYIPVLGVIREIYTRMIVEFEGLKLMGEADRVLNRVAAVENMLSEIYES
jgi:hypothetical protein